jgi:acetyl-CoA C-acetyltransferase
MSEVAIVGIGMHEFGRHDGVSGMEQGVVAVRRALADSGAKWEDMQFAFGGSLAAGAADTMVSQLGLTGLQFINVANGCATGGSALFSAYNTIRSGVFDLGIAIGFDKHERGAFRVNTKGSGLGDWYGSSGLALTTQFFGMKINRYMHEHGITQSTLAKVSEKAFRNGAKNPMAWRRKPISEAEVLESAMLSYPLTQYMFCSPGEGGVALILALEHNAGPTVDASKAAFEMAGMGPDDIDLAQLQDTESGAEVMHMAENGFCEHGEQERMIQLGETEIGGRFPVNTDGGCLANGEPIGASGLRQVYENVLQLRGQAGERQVPNEPRTAYTHVYGAPGISGVTILAR